MKDLSFWSHKTLSGKIRGRQIADWLGCKKNPDSGFENDICIFVKWTPAITKYSEIYIDVVDDYRYVNLVKEHPEWNCIILSETGYEKIKNEINNKVIFIPQHHCNYDRLSRNRNEITTVGFCGLEKTFAPYEEEIREKLKKIGLELKVCYDFKCRNHVKNFYLSIDIHIIWRIQYDNAWFRNPLKLSNAGSFGIPTIAQPELSFIKEYGDSFIPVNTIDQLICSCEDLKNDFKLYQDLGNKSKIIAENYHIDHISKLYRKLQE